jgi:hypothetical protein
MEMFARPLSLYLPLQLELRLPLYPLPSKTSEIWIPVLKSIAPLSFSLVFIIPKAQVLVSLHFFTTNSILLQLAASLPAYFYQSVV